MRKYVRLTLLLATFLVIYTSIISSILLAPWFSWSRNALSDLGHSVKSRVAVVYNFGLVSGGLLLALYSITYLKSETKLAWLILLISGFTLQLVGVYDEIYGRVHGLVSILFFIFLDIALLTYSIEKKSKLGFLLSALYIAVWIAYYTHILTGGVSIPEFVTSLIVSVFFVSKELQAIHNTK